MATIVNGANCSVEPVPGGTWLVTKIGGLDGAADAGAVSSEAFAGDFLLRVRQLGPGSAYSGVSADPLASHDVVGMSRAVQILSTLGRIFENGVLRPPTFAVVDYIWLRRIGSTLDYLSGSDPMNLSVKRTVPGVTGPLRFDSCLLTSGVQIEVKMDLPAAFTPRKRRRQRLSLGLTL